MGLTGKLLRVPPGSDSLESVSASDSDGVNHLILGEDGINRDLFFKVVLGPVNLLSNSASIDLNLHDVSFLLSTAKDRHLQNNE